jgi:hypothetical protein
MCKIKAPQSTLFEDRSFAISPGILNMWFSNNANLLTKVTLSRIGLNNASAIAISNILTKNKDNLVITQLDLSKNKIGNKGLLHICEMLKDNRKIQAMYLNDNSVSKRGYEDNKKLNKETFDTLRTVFLESDVLKELYDPGMIDFVNYTSTKYWNDDDDGYLNNFLRTLNAIKDDEWDEEFDSFNFFVDAYTDYRILIDLITRNKHLRVLKIPVDNINPNCHYDDLDDTHVTHVLAHKDDIIDAVILNPSLKFEGLGIKQGQVVLRKLKKGKEITDEKLDFTSLDPKMEDLLYLGEMLEGNTTVTELCLRRHRHPGHYGHEYITDMKVAGFTLHNFGENFYCIGLHKIVQSLEVNNTLTFLDLSNNYVNDRIIKELTFHKTKLKTLYLHISGKVNRELFPDYYITNEGAKKLGNWLQSNTSLTMLTIGFNGYGEGYKNYRTRWEDDDKTKEGADFLKKVEEESTNGLKIQMSGFDDNEYKTGEWRGGVK